MKREMFRHLWVAISCVIFAVACAEIQEEPSERQLSSQQTKRTNQTIFGSGFNVIAAGHEHSLVAKLDLSVYAWGRNENDRLGRDSFIFGYQIVNVKD